MATSWLVYRLAANDSAGKVALLLGVVSFAGQAPSFFLAPFAGVWIDRMNRHRILVTTQTLSMFQSFVLAYLALKHVITIPEIIGLNLFQGLINAIDIPTRQSFVVEMVENREDLGNAIALNSSMVHTARLLGPAIAGYIIYRVGEGFCFLIDGFSYLAVLVALLSMTIVKPARRSFNRSELLRDFREGLHYVRRFAPVRTILILVAITSLLSMSQTVLMPLFAGKVLGGGERIYGLLLGAAGCGALCGSIYLASRRSVVGLGRLMAFANGALGFGLIGFSFAKSMAVAVPFLFLTGAALVSQMASANTVLQTLVDDDKRGRVMSLFTMAFMGMAPFGSLGAGWVADFLGAPRTLLLSGVGCVLTSFWFFRTLPGLRPLIRPIYVRKGILPEVAQAMQSSMVRND